MVSTMLKRAILAFPYLLAHICIIFCGLWVVMLLFEKKILIGALREIPLGIYLPLVIATLLPLIGYLIAGRSSLLGSSIEFIAPLSLLLSSIASLVLLIVGLSISLYGFQNAHVFEEPRKETASQKGSEQKREFPRPRNYFNR